MNTERGLIRQIELKPASEQYWILLKDVTCADVNKVLEIYEETTEKYVAPIEEEDFNRLRDDFQNGNGLIEWEIAKGKTLEWRRLVTPDGMYVRFKFGGGGMNNTYQVDGVKKTIQTQIDNYFYSRRKSLSELV